MPRGFGPRLILPCNTTACNVGTGVSPLRSKGARLGMRAAEERGRPGKAPQNRATIISRLVVPASWRESRGKNWIPAFPCLTAGFGHSSAGRRPCRSVAELPAQAAQSRRCGQGSSQQGGTFQELAPFHSHPGGVRFSLNTLTGHSRNPLSQKRRPATSEFPAERFRGVRPWLPPPP